MRTGGESDMCRHYRLFTKILYSGEDKRSDKQSPMPRFDAFECIESLAHGVQNFLRAKKREFGFRPGYGKLIDKGVNVGKIVAFCGRNLCREWKGHWF